MNTKTAFSFYVNSNSIREMVLGLCCLSRQVFEISLNSSLITDELSNQGEEFRSFTVYSEKISTVSGALNTSCRQMVQLSTGMMENSLESTKQTERIERLRQGLLLVQKGSNFTLIERAAVTMAERTRPKLLELGVTIEEILKHLDDFEQSLNKLWLLCNNLKAQSEKDGVGALSNIIRKIETVLDHAGGSVHRLNGSLRGLRNQLKNME